MFNDGLQKIGRGAFQQCTSLTMINIPSTLTVIGDVAFSGCTNLRDVVFNEGLKKIGLCAFQYCLSLQNITLPSTVTDVGGEAFKGCVKLREIVFNDGIKKIGWKAFQNCTSLQSITLPSTVTDVRDEAFKGCTKLREVLLNEGIQKIEKRTFHGCTNLESLKFPSVSTRLENIIDAGHTEIENKVNAAIHDSGVERRGVVVSIPTLLLERDGWGAMRSSLDKIVDLIVYYEMKEATIIVELALWKAKIDQTDENNPADRDVCRIEVPGPVKDAILQYL